MRMILDGETRIRVEMAGDGFEIASEAVSLSPYHLLAGSLASCITLVIAPWAERSGIDLDPATISVSWEHASDHRVENMLVELGWPTLPDSQTIIVERLANACPIHATLLAGTEISTRVRPTTAI